MTIWYILYLQASTKTNFKSAADMMIRTILPTKTETSSLNHSGTSRRMTSRNIETPLPITFLQPNQRL